MKSDWRAFMTALRDDVTADRRFELVPSSCAPDCPTNEPALGDRLRAASQVGPQILIIGIVHKMSNAGAAGEDCCQRYDIPARRVSGRTPNLAPDWPRSLSTERLGGQTKFSILPRAAGTSSTVADCPRPY